MEIAHEAESARLPAPVFLVPLHALDWLSVNLVWREHRVEHVVAYDFLHDSDAADRSEHCHAITDSESVRLRVLCAPLLAFLHQHREGLLAIAVILHPQRDSFAADLVSPIRLEVYVHAEFDEGREALLRFVNPEGNHVRRNDEKFGVCELRTPAERVAIEAAPQGNFAVDAALDVADVDKVLHVYPGVHPTGAGRVGDLVGLLCQNFSAASEPHAASIERKSAAWGHVASKATFGVHSAPFSEVTPPAVQFQAR